MRTLSIKGFFVRSAIFTGKCKRSVEVAGNLTEFGKKIDKKRGKLTGVYNVVFLRQVTERHVVVCLVDMLLFQFVSTR